MDRWNHWFAWGLLMFLGAAPTVMLCAAFHRHGDSSGCVAVLMGYGAFGYFLNWTLGLLGALCYVVSETSDSQVYIPHEERYIGM